MKRKIFITALAAALSTLPVSAGAATQQRLCQNLERRLDAVAAPSPATRTQLDHALRRARQDGCDGYSLSRGSICRGHTIRIQRLQARVADMNSGGYYRGERARLRSAIRANGCRSVGRPQPDRGGMVVRVERKPEPVLDASGNIPVPTARPMSPAEEYRAEYVTYAKSLRDAADLREWARLVQPHPIPADRRAVRVVGAKFLPDPNEEMNFERIARGDADPLNDVLVSVMSWIDQGIVSTAVAQESESAPQEDVIRTASAE